MTRGGARRKDREDDDQEDMYDKKRGTEDKERGLEDKETICRTRKGTRKKKIRWTGRTERGAMRTMRIRRQDREEDKERC